MLFIKINSNLTYSDFGVGKKGTEKKFCKSFSTPLNLACIFILVQMEILLMVIGLAVCVCVCVVDGNDV